VKRVSGIRIQGAEVFCVQMLSRKGESVGNCDWFWGFHCKTVMG